MGSTIRTRETSSAVLLAFTAAVVLLGIVLAHPALLAPAAGAVRNATGGWLAPELIAAAVLSAVGLGGIVLAAGGLRPAEIGLSRTGLLAGVLTLLGVGAVFLAGVGAGLAGPDALRLYPGLDAWGTAGVAGFLLAALAMAAFTEAAFRGFLFPQLYLKLRRRGTGAAGALWSAVALSSLAAAAWYAAPLAFTHHKTGASFWLHLAGFAASGFVLCFFYLRTANLYVVIAGHALITVASQAFAASGRTAGLMMMLGLAFVVVWPRLRGRPLREPLATVTGPEQPSRRPAPRHPRRTPAPLP
jgi:membrane protease YdiL (CAAX protease family)